MDINEKFPALLLLCEVSRKELEALNAMPNPAPAEGKTEPLEPPSLGPAPAWGSEDDEVARVAVASILLELSTSIVVHAEPERTPAPRLHDLLETPLPKRAKRKITPRRGGPSKRGMPYASAGKLDYSPQAHETQHKIFLLTED